MKKIYNKKLFWAGVILAIIAIGGLFSKEYAVFAVFGVAAAVIAFLYFKKKPAAPTPEEVTRHQTASEMLNVPDDIHKTFNIYDVKPEEVSLPETIDIDGINYTRLYIYNGMLIVGTQHREEYVPLYFDDELILEQEPENEFDNKAVKVCKVVDGEKKHIGYLAAKNPRRNMVNDFLDRNEIVLARVDDGDKPSMTIAFYR